MKYDNSFKLEALALSDEIGPKKASEQLGIPYYTIADWRYDRKKHGKGISLNKGDTASAFDEKNRRIRELEAELQETRRANEILKDALGFFVERRKK